MSCPNDCPTGSVPRNRLMEHIRKDCKVKKEAKQVAEMRSQNAELRQKLKEKNDEDHELKKKVRKLEEELAKKVEMIEDLERKVSTSIVKTTLYT